MARALAVGIAATCAACSVLTSLDGLAGGAAADAAGGDATGDGPGTARDATDELATTDGGDGPTTGDADADAAPPVELHPNGTFEDGLAPWAAYHGTIASDTNARTGTKSLRPCAQPNTPADNVFSGDDEGAVPNPVIGATYHATVWVRTDPASATPPNGVVLLFRTIQLPNFAEIETVTTPPVTINATWKKLEIDLPVTKTAKALNIAVLGQYAAGSCFLIDDASVVRVP